MIAEISTKFAWYMARSSGLVEWAILTASIVWGLALSTRIIRRKGVPAWLLDLHKFLGTLSVVFLAIHLFALWIDNYVYFGWRELFVPWGSSYKPLSTALGPLGAGRMPALWGVLAMYMLIAIQVTSWMMKHLSRKLWHRVHLLSFPLFIVATLHGFTAGADNANLVVQWLALSAGLLVFFLIVFRLLAPRRARASRPASVETAAAA